MFFTCTQLQCWDVYFYISDLSATEKAKFDASSPAEIAAFNKSRKEKHWELLKVEPKNLALPLNLTLALNLVRGTVILP